VSAVYVQLVGGGAGGGVGPGGGGGGDGGDGGGDGELQCVSTAILFNTLARHVANA
jgi:hypothetical protein